MDNDENPDISRRRALQLAGGSLMALSATAGCITRPNRNVTGDEDRFFIMTDPFFILDKDGNPVNENYSVDEPSDDVLFDPLGEGPPLGQIIELGVEEYSGSEQTVNGNTFTPEIDAELFVPGIINSRRLCTKPPEGYDPDNPNETGNWPALTWNDYRTANASADLTLVNDENEEVEIAADATGTRFDIDVEGGIANGLYTFWVVKVVGGEVLGFHPLGDNAGGENILRLDSNGEGSLTSVNRGGPLNANPGFGTPPDESIPADIVNREEPDTQYWIASAYHYDDQTWGFYPGPNHVVPFVLVFQPTVSTTTSTEN